MLLWCLSITSLSHSELFSTERIKQYARVLNFHLPSVINETGNELWHGILRDCNKRVTFSCIQKNAYTYLDNVFIERDNITVFDGLTLTRNNVTYGVTCPRTEDRNDVRENLVDDVSADDCRKKGAREESSEEEVNSQQGRKFEDEPETPLGEIVNALRRKAVKFLSTRNYEVQLPRFFFEGATVKISPREIDESGALLRVDFGTHEVEEQGRIFKKLSNSIIIPSTNKLNVFCVFMKE